MKWLYDRIVTNWKSSAQGMVPAIVIIAGYYGYHFDAANLLIVFTGVYALLKLFARDSVARQDSQGPQA